LIRVSLRETTSKKVIFDYELLTKEERALVASGHTVHIVTNAKSEVTALPEDIRRRIAEG
jgi:acyl-CoA thioesterase FadM